MIICHGALYKEGGWDKYKAWLNGAAPNGFKVVHKDLFEDKPEIPGLVITLIDNITFNREKVWDVHHTFVTKSALLCAIGLNSEELKAEFDMTPIETTPELTETREV